MGKMIFNKNIYQSIGDYNSNMDKDCWLILYMVLSVIAFIAYLIIAIFVTPINVYCDYNDTIPDDAAIDLSMGEWISYGMIMGIGFFGLLGGCAKSKSNSDCMIVLLVAIVVLYVLYIFVWSIIGLVIYEDYYADACQAVDDYGLYAYLVIFFGLAFSSMHFLAGIIAGLNYCLKNCTCCQRVERVPLLREEEPQVPAPPLDSDIIAQIQASEQSGDGEKEYAKLPPKKEQVVVVVTDAQFQQNRNIYQHMFNRLSGNRWSRDHRSN